MDLDVYSDDESENDYTEKEKGLLNKVKNRNNKIVERSNAVLGFDDEDSEDDFDEEEDNDGDDDLLGSGEDYDGDIPDERAWGKNKRSYYDTGFVDQDYSTFNEKEEELAEQEEKEAKAIQLRLAKEFDEMDYKLDSFVPIESNENKKIDLDNVFKTDLSNISKREKLQLFKKDSPEFEELVQDFLFHLEESQKYLEPIQLHFNSDNVDHPLINFVKIRNNLILNYCTNIAFYLVLKSKKMFNKSHPIIKRLFQFRKLLLQLDEKYNDVIKPQLEVLLEKIENGEDINLTPPEEKALPQKLNILKNLEKGTTGSTKSKKVDKSPGISKEDLDDIRAELNDNDSSDEEQNDEEMDDQNAEEDQEIAEEEQKRGITYEIQKNKGLMPHRKKENRNPRVKHRNKYKKALVRRKGAVRTVRKEISRYAGELSGIKANVVKGIKIK